MAVYTYELNSNYNYPHINIYNRLRDGELTGYQARTDEDYVMYDSTANDTELMIDPDTGEIVYDPETGLPVEVPVTYYYTLAGFPKTYNFANFPWVAVPRENVDENYIYGGGNDNDHEVM